MEKGEGKRKKHVKEKLNVMLINTEKEIVERCGSGRIVSATVNTRTGIQKILRAIARKKSIYTTISLIKDTLRGASKEEFYMQLLGK